MSLGERIKFIVNASRPPLVLLFSTIILAGTMSVAEFSLFALPISIFYSFILSLLAFSLNDYFDKEIDKLNGKKGGIKGEIIDKSWKITYVKFIVILCSLTLFLTLPFLSSSSRLSIIALYGLSFLYSVPPIRLKSVPIIDAFANGVGVFLLFSLGTGIMGGNFSDILPAAYWGSLIFMPIDAMGSCPDIPADKSQDISTSGTLLGWKGCSIWFLSAVVSSMALQSWDPVPLLGHFYALFFGVSVYVKQEKSFFYDFIRYTFLLFTIPGVIWLLFQLGIV